MVSSHDFDTFERVRSSTAADDVPACADETRRDLVADVAAAAGDQDSHGIRHRRTAPAAIRDAFAIAVNTIGVPGIVGKTEASTT